MTVCGMRSTVSENQCCPHSFQWNLEQRYVSMQMIDIQLNSHRCHELANVTKVWKFKVTKVLTWIEAMKIW